MISAYRKLVLRAYLSFLMVIGLTACLLFSGLFANGQAPALSPDPTPAPEMMIEMGHVVWTAADKASFDIQSSTLELKTVRVDQNTEYYKETTPSTFNDALYTLIEATRLMMGQGPVSEEDINRIEEFDTLVGLEDFITIPINFADIAIGDLVYIELGPDNTASSVSILSNPHVWGKLTDISGNSITLSQANGEDITLNRDSSTRFILIDSPRNTAVSASVTVDETTNTARIVCVSTPFITLVSQPSESPAPVRPGEPTTDISAFNLEGRVLYSCNRKPASGYYVYIFPGDEGTSYARGPVTVDEKGIYHANLPPGTYRLVAHQQKDIRGFSYFHQKVNISSEHKTVVEDILLQFCPELELVAPANGAHLSTGYPSFIWESFPGASGYRVYVQADSGKLYRFPSETLKMTTETRMTAPESLPAGRYEWYIEAYRSGSIFDIIGESSRWSFTIEP